MRLKGKEVKVLSQPYETSTRGSAGETNVGATLPKEHITIGRSANLPPCLDLGQDGRRLGVGAKIQQPPETKKGPKDGTRHWLANNWTRVGDTTSKNRSNCNAMGLNQRVGSGRMVEWRELSRADRAKWMGGDLYQHLSIRVVSQKGGNQPLMGETSRLILEVRPMEIAILL